jgi:uncharacterized membrane protein
MLVVFPIGLWVFSFVCDVIARRSVNPGLWTDMAFYTMAGGVIGALAAAVPGFIDYQHVAERQPRRIAATHMTLNLVVVVAYVFNLGLRMSRPAGDNTPGLLISAVALVLLAISGWLGGSLVYEHGLGVNVRTQASTDRTDRAA